MGQGVRVHFAEVCVSVAQPTASFSKNGGSHEVAHCDLNNLHARIDRNVSTGMPPD